MVAAREYRYSDRHGVSVSSTNPEEKLEGYRMRARAAVAAARS